MTRPLLVAQPMDTEDMYSHELDKAESAADLMWIPKGPLWPTRAPQHVVWKHIAFTGSVSAGSTVTIDEPLQRRFRPRWLIVSTPGFDVRLVVSHRILILDYVDGNLFMGAHWDRLEREGQLDRVRLPDMAIDVGNTLSLSAKKRDGLLRVAEWKYTFRAVVIGEEDAQAGVY